MYSNPSRHLRTSATRYLKILITMKILFFLIAIVLGKYLITSVNSYYHCCTNASIDLVKITNLAIKSEEEDTKQTYVVFTEHFGIFYNTDSQTHPKQNSQGIWEKLEKNKCYSIKYYGWRIPLYLYTQTFLKCIQKNVLLKKANNTLKSSERSSEASQPLAKFKSFLGLFESLVWTFRSIIRI